MIPILLNLLIFKCQHVAHLDDSTMCDGKKICPVLTTGEVIL